MQDSDGIVAKLVAQNNRLKKESQQWKKRYQQLKVNCDLKKQCSIHSIGTQFTSQKIQENQINTHNSCKKQSDINKEILQTKQNLPVKQEHKEYIQWPIFEGCFILKKNESYTAQKYKQLFIPQTEFNRYNKILQMTHNYLFPQNHIIKIQDDVFNSRANQINYSVRSQLYTYTFEHYRSNNSPKILSSLHQICKQYVYVLKRPQIIHCTQIHSQMIQDKQVVVEEQAIYETQIAYGFITWLPFNNLFSNTIQAIQQQLKIQYIQNKEKERNWLQNRINSIKCIMHDLFNKQNLLASKLPLQIQFQFSRKIQTIKFKCQNQNQYQHYIHEACHFNTKKYSLEDIGLGIHYMLNQRHFIIAAKSLKIANDFYFALRMFIYPFNWCFPVIYRYSDAHKHLLSSPIPIIFCVSELTQIQQNLPKQQSKKSKKVINQKKETAEKQCNKFLKSIGDNDVWPSIKNYILKLKQFIDSGKIKEQMSQFHIDFIDTQMVSFYKNHHQH